MNYLKSSYVKKYIRMLIIYVVFCIILGGCIYSSIKKGTPDQMETSILFFKLLIVVFGIFLFIWFLGLNVNKNKKIKKLAILPNIEQQQLEDLLQQGKSTCNCYFTKSHLVHIGRTVCNVMPYSNISRINMESGSSFVVHLQNSDRESCVLLFDKVQTKEDYDQLCEKLTKLNPSIKVTAIKSNLC